MPGQLTMYTTTWCGFCRNLKRQLNRDGIEVTVWTSSATRSRPSS